MNILVTDGESRAALAITRSLGLLGYRVYVADKSALSLASCSRYCHQGLAYADPAHDAEAFINTVEALIREYRIDLLVPVTDICVLPISRHRDRLGRHCNIPLANDESLRLAANKQELHALATQLHVATPRTVTLCSKGDITPITAELGFPLVIKPCRSRIPHNGGMLFTTADYATSESDLLDKLAGLPAEVYPVLLQERIAGPGMGAFYCYDNGRKIASFAHRRLREKPPSGGVSVLRESIAINELADDFSTRLLDHLEWHGVAMVEFKLDQCDQTPKLMEINGRFWGSLQLAIDAGVDFPGILADVARGKAALPVRDYRIGVRSRWLWGDIDLLLMLLLKSNQELNLPAGHESRIRSIAGILKPFNSNQRLEVLRLNDPKPWLHESKKWFSR